MPLLLDKYEQKRKGIRNYSPLHPRTSNRNEGWTIHSRGLIRMYLAYTGRGNVLVTGVFLSLFP